MPDGLRFEKLNYNSYLHIPELLELQKPVSQPEHHDEMFFIVIHQAAELWFKLMLHETEALIRALREPSISRALKILKRLRSVMQLQVEQTGILATLTPVEFAGFREQIRPASGFQSMQFRVIEFAYGVREPFFLKFFEKMPEATAKLEHWLARPSVAEEFADCVRQHAPKRSQTARRTLPREEALPAECDRELLMQMLELYENPGSDYHWVLLFEALIDFDQQFSSWRSVHLLMVARTIGFQPGTGGSSGHAFLQGRSEFRFFKELWALRTQVGPEYARVAPGSH